MVTMPMFDVGSGQADPYIIIKDWHSDHSGNEIGLNWVELKITSMVIQICIKNNKMRIKRKPR